MNHVHCETDQAADGFTKFGLDMLESSNFFFLPFLHVML